MDKNQEKFWDNLTKEYLTTEQKLAIIREHNTKLSDEEWLKTMDALADYINHIKK